MCNPGGTAALLGLQAQGDTALFMPGVTRQEVESQLGRELGVVRISLGLASNFHDVYRVLRFAESVADKRSFSRMWNSWRTACDLKEIDQPGHTTHQNQDMYV